jgi:hypothetical protein
MRNDRLIQKLLPLAALMLACGVSQAANPPKVMFVSGKDAKPVLVDLAGREIPAQKGQAIPPGFSVKVPEGATVQIMTDEKAIVAIRQGSLLKFEELGDGDKPHRFKLDNGGLRIANPDKKPHKFEVDTPNAKLRFDKGDHEAFYLKDGNKATGDKWGTFVRGFKEEAVLSTKDGDTKIDKSVIGYVPGASLAGKTELIDRVKTGVSLSDPVTGIFTGAKGSIPTDIKSNQETLAQGARSTSPDLKLDTQAPVSFKTPVEPVITPPITVVGNTVPVKGANPALTNLNVAVSNTGVSPTTLNPKTFTSGSSTMAAAPMTTPTDLVFDKSTNTAILLKGSTLTLLAPTRELANTTPKIDVKEITISKTPVVPPPTPPAGTVLTKEQTVTKINTTLTNTNILKKR